MRHRDSPEQCGTASGNELPLDQPPAKRHDKREFMFERGVKASARRRKLGTHNTNPVKRSLQVESAQPVWSHAE